MKKINYKVYDGKKLKEMLQDLKLQYMQSCSLMEKPKVKKEYRSKIRREIARIKTEQTRRKNDK